MPLPAPCPGPQLVVHLGQAEPGQGAGNGMKTDPMDEQSLMSDDSSQISDEEECDYGNNVWQLASDESTYAEAFFAPLIDEQRERQHFLKTGKRRKHGIV